MGVMPYWSKTAEQSAPCGQLCSKITHHAVGKYTESLQKNSLKLKVSSHNSASWYTETDGFLEHSLCKKKPVVQGAPAPRR